MFKGLCFHGPKTRTRMNAAISQAIETEKERVARLGRLELPTRCLEDAINIFEIQVFQAVRISAKWTGVPITGGLVST